MPTSSKKTLRALVSLCYAFLNQNAELMISSGYELCRGVQSLRAADTAAKAKFVFAAAAAMKMGSVSPVKG